MANRLGSNRLRRAIPGVTCGHTNGTTTCLHLRAAHKFDEIDGSDWCDECWADADPAYNQISYHAFEQGVFANA